MKIQTGCADGAIAHTLIIQHRRKARGTRTYVRSQGEANNAEPWSYAGKVPAKEVLKRYFADMHNAEGFDPTKDFEPATKCPVGWHCPICGGVSEAG